MELKYHAFHLLLKANPNRGFTLNNINGTNNSLWLSDTVKTYLSSGVKDIPQLTEDQILQLERIKNREDALYNEVSLNEVLKEINFNLANIETDGQVKRYLTYLYSELVENLRPIVRHKEFKSVDISIKPFSKFDPLSDTLRAILWNIRKVETILQYVDYLLNGESKKNSKNIGVSNGAPSDIDPFLLLFKREFHPYIDKFISVLSEVTPPLINDLSEWIKPVGAAKVFVEILKEKGVINPKASAELIYNGFDYKFNTGRSFMKDSKMVKANDYRSDLAERIELVLKSLQQPD